MPLLGHSNVNITQAKAGKSYYHKQRKNGVVTMQVACCDCGLVHSEEYKVLKKNLRIRVWRNEPLTEEIRKLRKHLEGKR